MKVRLKAHIGILLNRIKQILGFALNCSLKIAYKISLKNKYTSNNSTIMNKQFIILVILSISFFQLKAQDTIIKYIPDTVTVFPNPERGWRQQVCPECCDNPPLVIKGPHPPLTFGKLISWYHHSDAITIFQDLIKIQDWNADIPQERLDQIQEDLNTVRLSFCKSVIRIVYNWSINNDDPHEEQIIRHLEQLKPIIRKNSDVIFAFELGTFGGTGEACCGSKFLADENNGSTSLTKSGILIYDSIASMVPKDRMVTIHYPRYKFNMMGWSEGNMYPSKAIALNETNAFDGSRQSRIGFYNDNFAGDEDHYGFFNAWIPEEKQFTIEETKYVNMQGEIQSATDYNKKFGAYEAKKYHFSALHLGGDDWDDVSKAWKESGQFDQMSKYLGYRFRLIESQIPLKAVLGSTFKMSLVMANDGWARIMNPRKVEIILKSKTSDKKYVIDVDGDGRGNRLWLPGPGETKTLTICQVLPEDLLPGEYELFLNLPDPYPSIHDIPGYSIRLANKYLWQMYTGYNALNAVIKVNKIEPMIKRGKTKIND